MATGRDHWQNNIKTMDSLVGGLFSSKRALIKTVACVPRNGGTLSTTNSNAWLRFCSVPRNGDALSTTNNYALLRFCSAPRH